VVVGARPE
jgi:hypothetical protein